MARAFAFAALFMTVLVAGWSGGNPHEQLAQETIAKFNEMAAILESSKDSAEAKPRLETVAANMRDLKKRMDALGEPSAEIDKHLKAKLEPQMNEAMKRYTKALFTFMQKDPAGVKALMPVFEGLK